MLSERVQEPAEGILTTRGDRIIRVPLEQLFAELD
jgi:hypothetical protein